MSTLAAKDATAEARSAAASAMGKAKTERKAAAARANGFKPGNAGGGRKPLALFSLACNCGAGDVAEGHKTSCPRGQAVKRRKAEGRDLLTGEKIEAAA